MVEGVAEYKEPSINNGNPYRIFVGESTIKNMDATFSGRPVYVRHVDDVNLDNLQVEADGYVVESFFNKLDGKHWAKFIVVSDKGHEAIRSGWKLSNAYIPKRFDGGGLWHGVEYAKEVVEGEYEHLALVPNPRYEESIILTPDEFKTYNNEKELELKKLSNSITKGAKSMFNFFKKTKVENGADFESMSVILPESKIEKTISQIINESDMAEMKEKEEKPMANMDHHVMVKGKAMKLCDAMKHYEQMLEAPAAEEKKSPEHEKKESPAEEKKEHNDESIKEMETGNSEGEIHVDIDSHKGKDKEEMNDMSDEEAKKKALQLAEHEEKEIEEEDEMMKKKKNAHFEALRNAEFEAHKLSNAIELSSDRVARGKSRYGSN
jgi:hypothetical protein